MNTKKTYLLFFLFACLWWACGSDEVETIAKDTETMGGLSPDARYGFLFLEVQKKEVFKDSKTFADCIPKRTTVDIVAAFEEERSQPGFDLKAFVDANFEKPIYINQKISIDSNRTVFQYIQSQLPALQREVDLSSTSSLLGMTKPYLASATNMDETYYWNSYFTMLGLKQLGDQKMMANMVENCTQLMGVNGQVPSSNRSYSTSRSHPPHFALMVNLLLEESNPPPIKTFLPWLQREYDFWMDGLVGLSSDNPSYRRVVRLETGQILNRYWDDDPKPRPEQYREDKALARSLVAPKEKSYQQIKAAEETTYRHIRAAAESGWDFSSRWFSDQQYMASIHTTDIIPVDLNALLYYLEATLSKAYASTGDDEQAVLFEQRMTNRRAAIMQFCWNAQNGFFMDYDWVARKQTGVYSLAAVYPLFFSIADTTQAVQVAVKLKRDFLKPEGLVCTTNETGQQWDAPFGWAPLHWMAVRGLDNYGLDSLSQTISNRWVDLNLKAYQQNGEILGKYNVVNTDAVSESNRFQTSKDKFNWGNDVLLNLINLDSLKKAPYAKPSTDK